MPRVTITSGETTTVVEVAEGTTLFEAGAKIAAGIETSCVGKGTCGLCRVKIVGGAETLNPFTDEEKKHLGNVYHLTKVRLSCRSKVGAGDVAIEVVKRRR